MNQEFYFCKNVNQETLGSKPLLAKSEITFLYKGTILIGFVISSSNIICINYIRTRISN
jgi:hypothetical protein